MTRKTPQELSQLTLFAGLEPASLERIAAALTEKTFPRGVNIMLAGEPGERVLVLLEGTVKIFIDRIDGAEVILAFLGPGDPIGEMSPVDATGRSASAVTVEKCHCLSLSSRDFKTFLREIPGLGFNLTLLLTRRLRMANEQIQALATLDVRGRVARQIVAFAQQYGRRGDDRSVYIPLRLTQTDLAAIVGASRESVNQAIVSFKQDGILSVDPRHRITVHDPRRLLSSDA